MNETIEFEIKTTGAEATSRAFKGVSDSMGKTSKEFTEFSNKTAKANAVASAFGQALAPLSPELATLATSASRATGVISNMTSLMGGVWGPAIGALAIVVGVLAKKYSDAEKEAKRLTQEMKEQAEVAKELAAIKERFSGDNDPGAVWMDTMLAEQDKTREAQRQAALQKMANDEEVADAAGQFRKRKRSGPSFNDTINELAGDGEMGSPELGVLEPERQALWEAEQERKRQAHEEEKERIKVEREMEREAAREREEQLARLDAIESESRELRMGAARDMFNINTKLLSDLAKGNKLSAKAIVGSIGDSLVARGSEALWQGLIMSANPFTPGMGAGLIATGGAAMAAGLTMGAATRGMGGGGGGGGGGTQFGSGGQSSSPVAPIALDRTGGDQRPTTIHVTMPSVVAPSAEDGERVLRAVEEAKRQGRV